MQASERDGVIDDLIAESENPSTDGKFVGTFDWDNIVQWLKDNWLEILKLVLTLFLLFLGENPETD